MTKETKTITVYISFDGKEFATEKECCEYEMLFNDILPMIKKLNKICKSHQTCENCKFSYDNEKCLFVQDVPEYWNLKEFTARLGD